LDFRFVHDPSGIAQPYAIAKIAGGQRGDISLQRLLHLNGKRLAGVLQKEEKEEKDGDNKVDENDSKSNIKEELSSMDLTLRVTVEPEDLLRIQAATKLRKGEEETTELMITQVDVDESKSYSNIVRVAASGLKNKIFVSPNPVEEKIINLYFTDQPKGKYVINILNAKGHQIKSLECFVTNANISFKLSAKEILNPGIYFLKVDGPNNTVTVIPALIQ
jgi:hypothetical protein